MESDSSGEMGLPAVSEDGVDLTLIRSTLLLTPAERLQFLQNAVRSILRIRAKLSES